MMEIFSPELGRRSTSGRHNILNTFNFCINSKNIMSSFYADPWVVVKLEVDVLGRNFEGVNLTGVKLAGE